MRTSYNILQPVLGAAAILSLASTGAIAQHVHGVIELGVVVEGNTVAISMNAPLSDVVGFEHAPENDEQKKLIEQAAMLLSNADAMFGMAGSVDCSVSKTSVDGPAYITGNAGNAATENGDHHDAHAADEAGSAEAEHSHEDHDDHDHDSDHGEHAGHADIVANYEWACVDAASIEALEL